MAARKKGRRAGKTVLGRGNNICKGPEVTGPREWLSQCSIQAVQSVTWVLYQGQGWRVKQGPDYRNVWQTWTSSISICMKNFLAEYLLVRGEHKSEQENKHKDAGRLKAEREEKFPGEKMKTPRGISWEPVLMTLWVYTGLVPNSGGKTWDSECLYNLRGARMPVTASEICRAMLPQESGGPRKCCLCITCPLQDRRTRSKAAGRIRHLPSRKSWCCLPGLVPGLPEPVQAPAGCSLSDLRERKVPQELQERKTQHRVLSGRIYGSSTLHPLWS